MKSNVFLLLFMTLVFGLSLGCSSGLKGSSSGGGGSLRTESLSDGALIDQMGPTSSFTLEQPLYVPANSNVVTDIAVDHTRLLNCELTLATSENQTAAHWLPAGTKYNIVHSKIGTDRSLALAIEDGEPFDVPRLSCWGIKESQDPFTLSFLQAALAGSISIDGRQ